MNTTTLLIRGAPHNQGAKQDGTFPDKKNRWFIKQHSLAAGAVLPSTAYSKFWALLG